MIVYYKHTHREETMTETQERAIRIREMSREAEILSMESGRLGAKIRGGAKIQPHACYDGWVFVGVVAEDGGLEEVAYLCQRCAEAK
jgi:hypothetical protein